MVHRLLRLSEKRRSVRMAHRTLAFKAGDQLIPFTDVKRIDIANVEWASVKIITHSGEEWEATGIDAIEAVMLMKPSALEGRRLKWQQGAWVFHNLVGHPVMQIMAWMGFKRQAVRFHDFTTPTPKDFKK